MTLATNRRAIRRRNRLPVTLLHMAIAAAVIVGGAGALDYFLGIVRSAP